MRQFFGTDGIRGRVGTFPITPDFVLKLGWAVGKILSAEGEGTVLVGKDTRISGYMFESALEAGLLASGINVCLTGPLPTPAIAYLTRTFNGQAGIVISASHNPYYDNGIKFFAGDGTKLPDSVEKKIEALLEDDLTVVESGQLGKVTRLNDASGRYIEYCKASIKPQLDLSGMNIVVDAGHGATYLVGPAVFKELGANVHTIGTEPNGININKECGSTQPEKLAAAVTEQQADLGIAFDGDGDRVIMIDDNGSITDGDELLYIIARNLHQQDSLKGGVAGTIMSNLGMEKALADLNIPFARANVGDRYVNQLLLEKNWFLGGESSGHIICRDIATTGDGVVSALQVVRAMLDQQKPLSELRKNMTRYPQSLINVSVNQKKAVESVPEIVRATDESQQRLGDRGRILIRPSGTEPVVRVMVEGEEQSEVDSEATRLAEVVQACLS